MDGDRDPFRSPVHVRYLDVDQQRVVYHMWYLAYVEDARNAFLRARGLPLADLVGSGCDLQLVHTEFDWRGSLRWADDASVTVAPSGLGRHTFTIDYGVCADAAELVHGRTVYVTVDRSGAKRPVPDSLRTVLVAEMDRLGQAS